MQEAVRLPADAAALVVLLLPLVDEAAAEAAVTCFDIKLAVALADDAEGFLHIDWALKRRRELELSKQLVDHVDP
jgi:hypothetical protein